MKISQFIYNTKSFISLNRKRSRYEKINFLNVRTLSEFKFMVTGS